MHIFGRVEDDSLHYNVLSISAASFFDFFCGGLQRPTNEANTTSGAVYDRPACAMASDKQDDFKSLQEGIQKSLVSTTKAVNRLTAEDLAFQRAVNPDVASQLDEKTARLLGLSTRLLKSAARACGIQGAPSLEDAEDIDVSWRGVVDVVDSVLEKADTALDEYTGLVKRKDPPTADSVCFLDSRPFFYASADLVQAQKPKKAKTTNKVVRNANITKPQIHFEKPVDNFPSGPWKPMLTKKPHAIVPLEKSLRLSSPKNGESQYALARPDMGRQDCADLSHRYKHPYETEITRMEYPERVYQVAEPILYQPAETTQATWVDTYEGVLDMLEDLRDAKEIAVDLEHHDTRTYTGLVCLMQVSTREKDWIVDTLQPWRHKLEVLNEVFADPGIVKVFHGAYMDMIWLQRDLGLYINGLFDTFFACEQLYPGRSLAFLLSKFVDFDADKQYQLADWRIRYVLLLPRQNRDQLTPGPGRSQRKCCTTPALIPTTFSTFTTACGMTSSRPRIEATPRRISSARHWQSPRSSLFRGDTSTSTSTRRRARDRAAGTITSSTTRTWPSTPSSSPSSRPSGSGGTTRHGRRTRARTLSWATTTSTRLQRRNRRTPRPCTASSLTRRRSPGGA